MRSAWPPRAAPRTSRRSHERPCLAGVLGAVAALSQADPQVCILDPEFDAGRLEAWKAGADDEEVVAHLGACAACRGFVAALAPLSALEVSGWPTRCGRSRPASP
ncbi:MAG: hypothetical protein R3F60_09670 [bacterium]